MTRYLPIALGVLLIVGLTIPQIIMTDRLSGTNVSAEQRAELLKLVPKDFGDWHGQDKPVDPNVKETAGAVGAAVSRDYRNSKTGERVDLWLIVGHARDISAHTPDICYPASGFEARAQENAIYPLIIPGLPDSPFWTNTFYRENELTGRRLIRVFWSWYNPEDNKDSQVVWDAPQNARWHFGNTRALYKMYFTSEMRDPMETAEQSACIHFARDFLPEVNKALAAVSHKPEADGAASSTDDKPAEAAATPASEQSIGTSTAAPSDTTESAKMEAPAGTTATEGGDAVSAPKSAQ
jgi:hypothetical protein